MAISKRSVPPVGPSTIGGHLALDLLNTVVLENGSLVDSFETDEDVLIWLARNDWPVASEYKPGRASTLLTAARSLRETVRSILEKLRDGKKPDLESLNIFLKQASFQLNLVPDGRYRIKLERKSIRKTPYQALSPIAESAAELIAEGDLHLVRKCEDDACVLWFYDRTKSHLRRWCSSETCGNRNKVRSFRERQKELPAKTTTK